MPPEATRLFDVALPLPARIARITEKYANGPAPEQGRGRRAAQANQNDQLVPKAIARYLFSPELAKSLANTSDM